MAKWYYSAEGHATGPVDERELGELASKGVVCTETLIWQPEMAEWEPVWKLKPQIIERLNKSAMAKQAKGSTDRIPAAEAPSVASGAAPKKAPSRSNAPAGGPPPPSSEEPKPGLLSRLFGRKKK